MKSGCVKETVTFDTLDTHKDVITFHLEDDAEVHTEFF